MEVLVSVSELFWGRQKSGSGGFINYPPLHKLLCVSSFSCILWTYMNCSFSLNEMKSIVIASLVVECALVVFRELFTELLVRVG